MLSTFNIDCIVLLANIPNDFCLGAAVVGVEVNRSDTSLYANVDVSSVKSPEWVAKLR